MNMKDYPHVESRLGKPSISEIIVHCHESFFLLMNYNILTTLVFFGIDSVMWPESSPRQPWGKDLGWKKCKRIVKTQVGAFIPLSHPCTFHPLYRG